MSYLQTLCNTYDAISNIAGKIIEKQDGDALILSPLGHIRTETHISVILNENGEAIDIKSEVRTICMPSDIDAESRTSTTVAPYPLTDQLEYIAGDCANHGINNQKKFGKYIAALKAWSESDYSHPKIRAVYAYLSKKVLIHDLIEREILSYKGKLLVNKDRYTKAEKEKINRIKDGAGKLRARFEVEIPGENETGVCEDEKIQKLYADYYMFTLNKIKTRDLCYISGQKLTIATSHPKNINRITAANAKLVSSNDKTNFTFRGRFQTPEQAATISYEASQKAHQALRYLIDERGITCGSQAIIAFAADHETAVVEPYADSKTTYEQSVCNKTDNEQITQARGETAKDYARLFNSAIFDGSAKSAKAIKKYRRKIAILATDAATKGRMSVVFYREFNECEYLAQLIQWHETCKWRQSFWDKDNERVIDYIGAPSMDAIIEATLGKPRSDKDESYYKLKKNARKQLLHCILNGEQIPFDMLQAALRRASNPLVSDKKHGYSAGAYNRILSAACAIWRKHYIDHKKKEEFAVELEEDRDDRDYLYGRLLAVADRIESHAMYSKDIENANKRPTNALRFMAAFAQQPFHVWSTIHAQIVPYMLQLGGAGWYQDIIAGIKKKFKKDEEEDNSPLDGRYLLGYYAQRYALLHKQKRKENGNESAEQD